MTNERYLREFCTGDNMLPDEFEAHRAYMSADNHLDAMSDGMDLWAIQTQQLNAYFGSSIKNLRKLQGE